MKIYGCINIKKCEKEKKAFVSLSTDSTVVPSRHFESNKDFYRHFKLGLFRGAVMEIKLLLVS